MNNIRYIIVVALFAITQLALAQEPKTDANIFGHVICKDCDDHISFASIGVKGTTIGTTTDETGHFQLINLAAGTHIIRATFIGYKPQEIEVTLKKGETKEINFELEQDMLGLEEVVITGDRNETNRKGSSTIVNTLTPKLFSSIESPTLSEGLNFSPGLRMENNCQNCGFSQVRMNGMEGPYSQILINSRPIFSGLVGVYGLELIPSNMIERVEVVRGGGSALYGGNAIAGTINLILKDPINNSYEFGVNSGLIGFGVKEFEGPAQDNTINFNSSLVSADNKTGMSLYGFYRDREPFDANGDEFCEIASLKNTTIGSRIYHRFGNKSKVSGDFFNINEDRRGGDKHDYVFHEADIAEAVTHNITTGAISYDHFFRKYDLFSAYASGQNVNRDSYYGAEQSLSDYGNTKDFSYAIGAQYNARLGKSNAIVGVENVGAWLKDEKLGYMDIENAIINGDSIQEIPHTENVIVADQTTNTIGIFTQYELDINKLKISAGARFDSYQVKDNKHIGSDKSGAVLSPRITIKYDIYEHLQARTSYSQGYRAPQIFDEDLHIETSGSRKVIHENDPGLKQETSSSFMASLDFNKKLGGVYFGLLIEGFYTHLTDPFANQYSDPDENGTVVYTRINAEEGATVKGVNIEMNLIPFNDFAFTSGFTLQNSEYEEVQEFDEKTFIRTPDKYGYFVIDWDFAKKFCLSTSGNYAGEMLVPYFGNTIANQDDGELRISDSFFDLGFKLRYDVKINGATFQPFIGVKNILNSYQDDFDKGIDRDPGYIYGPMTPMMIYAGFKIGNFLR